MLAAFVGYHCLWALGLEYGHLEDGEKVGARTVVHGVLGCTVFGAAVVKVVAVRTKRAPGWFLPVAGGLLFTLFVAVVLTSARLRLRTANHGRARLERLLTRRAALPGGAAVLGGRYWVRTSDLFGVNEARYHCANRPG